MSDLALRLSLIGVVLVAVVVTIWVTHHRRQTGFRSLVDTGLTRGIYLFTSSTCPDCGPVRDALSNHIGPDGYTELSWEGDRALFESLRIDAVPATMVVDDAGTGSLWPGSPDEMFWSLILE